MISGGDVLTAEGTVERVDVVCDGPTIGALTGTAGVGTIDATDALVLPGIIDVHGDAFERALMPRPGVFLGADRALDETRPQLLAAGITTAFISVTDSWEPGLRCREQLRGIIDEVTDPEQRRRPPRLEIHVRHETCNTDDIDELLDWVADGTVAMLSYGDHTPGGIAMVKGVGAGRVQRADVAQAELEALQDEAIERRALGREQERLLAAAAHEAGIPTACHDPSSLEDLERDLALDVRFAEFPVSIQLARRYREHDLPVLLGAPNLARGGSHCGNLAVSDAWLAGAADLLCSDYHYASLLNAPFVLLDLGATLAEAWATVAATPARVAGLDDRGTIAPEQTADLAVVEPPADGRGARVRAVVVDGELAYYAG